MSVKRKPLWIIVLLLMFSGTLIGQSYFNRAIGGELPAPSSRAAAMGSTSGLSSRSPFWVRTNPAALTGLPRGLYASVDLGIETVKESRSYPVIDSFGDFLTDNTYVQNLERYDHTRAGLSWGLNLLSATAALAVEPVMTFDYRYREEIRESEFGYNRDPLAGYHILEAAGEISVISAGGGIVLPLTGLRLGAGIHFPKGEHLTMRRSVKALRSSDNLASTSSDYDTTSSYKTGDYFYSGSFQWEPSQHLTFMGGFESDAKYEFSPVAVQTVFDTTLGLPAYSLTQHRDSLWTPAFVKPGARRIGFTYRPRQEYPTELSVEVIWRNYSAVRIDDIAMRDVVEYHGGLEYIVLDRIPVRVGFVFAESPLKREYAISKFTAGTGGSVMGVTVDLSFGYGQISYAYTDIFPVAGEQRTNLDQVTESVVSLGLALSYHFGGGD